tara:strand:+ start:3833 stop:4417 length:585 start_codon:yes stop_codon:yes gene_type:complete
MQFEIFKFDTVASTNDVAMDLIKDKKKEAGFVYADIQTHGRGTKGRKWISEMGNLFVSIFFPLKSKFPPFNEFSIINPVIISNVIKKFCTNKQISFKWPNDIFINGRKICGILQEVITSKEKKFLIIGVGINIISNPKINNNYEATNIFFESNQKPKTQELIKLLVKSYEKFFIEIETYNFMNFKAQADQMSVK